MALPHALSHSPDPDPDSLGLHLYQSFLRNSLTVILNLHMNLIGLSRNTDYGHFATRMAMDVCQTFLYETKYGQFYLRGKPFKVGRNIQLNMKAAALRQTVYVPANCRRQSVFV